VVRPRFSAVGFAALHHQLRGGVAGDREAQLVLDRGEEGPGRVRRAVVVDAAGGEHVAHLLVEALLGRPDVPDAVEQLVEVVGCAGILEPAVVEHEALDEVLAQDGGRPLPEVHGVRAGDAVADGEHHVQVVDLDLTPDGSRALLLNL
jgi:hypothetical protein